MKNKKLNSILEHFKDIIETSLENTDNQVNSLEDGFFINNYESPPENTEHINKEYIPVMLDEIFIAKVFIIDGDKEKYIFAGTSIEVIESYMEVYIKSIKDSLPDDCALDDVYVCDHFGNIIYEIDKLPVVG